MPSPTYFKRTLLALGVLSTTMTACLPDEEQCLPEGATPAFSGFTVVTLEAGEPAVLVGQFKGGECGPVPWGVVTRFPDRIEVEKTDRFPKSSNSGITRNSQDRAYHWPEADVTLTLTRDDQANRTLDFVGPGELQATVRCVQTEPPDCVEVTVP